MERPLLVISLKRTPERLRTFYKINEHALVDWKIDVIDGIDGIEQEKINNQSRWVSASARENWTEGAIGSALSHIKAWRRCIELDQDVLIAEDDAVLSKDLKDKLEALKLIGGTKNKTQLILLGWNTDSLLHAELSPGLDMISLFEPIYPGLEELEEIINSERERDLCILKRCFGLPAYLISPQVACELLAACMPLQTEINRMTRGIPEHMLVTLDGMLTNRYEKIKAKVTIPPLALALNNQATSLTKRKNIRDFEG